MANDSNELKNNAPCEEKQEARQLSEEELEQVTGGQTGFFDPKTGEYCCPGYISIACILYGCKSALGDADIDTRRYYCRSTNTSLQ